MQLVIVESPYKKKTLQKYLGTGWRVEACMGHICDLPHSELGIKGPLFQPRYELFERGKLIVENLKKIMKEADCIWLATDPDREGEAIAWHLANYLQAKSLKRIRLYEITPKSVQAAIQDAGAIDQRLVEAQQARRVIDRLVGYQVSPRLSQVLQKPLSAGRVQSIALKLLVEQERSIRQFRAIEHFGVRLHFDNTAPWFADWDTEAVVGTEIPYIFDWDLAKKVATIKEVQVTQIETKEVQKNAPPPFITSTLQKAAFFVLGWNAEFTMSIAQRLFEGGFISYHRTDNPNFLEATTKAARKAIIELGYEKHLPQVPNQWSTPQYSQEAHEAIHPTDFLHSTLSLENVSERALYGLIHLRALASQLAPAVVEMQNITLMAKSLPPGISENNLLFKAKGQKLVYPGWQYLVKRDESEEAVEDDINSLPLLNNKDVLTPSSSEVLTVKTRAPKRYSEPALISKLEKEGIGRPSTYALILSTLQKRGYVVNKNKLFHPQPIAEAIIDTLQGKFKFLELSYTRDIEADLDSIARGQKNYQDIVSKIDQELQNGLAALEPPSYCQNCQAPLKPIWNKQGSHLVCSRYPEGCKTALNVKEKTIETKVTQETLTDKFCPICRKALQYMEGKHGPFWSCSGYPTSCNFTLSDKTYKKLYPSPRFQKSQCLKSSPSTPGNLSNLSVNASSSLEIS